MYSSLLKLMLFTSLGAFCCFAVAEETHADDTPSPLARLNEHLYDRETFERKVRALDKLYTIIAHMKMEEARSLKERGDAEGVRIALGEAGRHLAEVKEAYVLGLAHFGESALLHTFYGELLHDHLGQEHEAVKHWEEAVRLDKAYGRAQNNLGMYYLHVGRYDEGLVCMDAALAAEPGNPDWWFNMVQVYLTNFTQIMKIRGWDRAKVYEEAMRMSERALALSPSDYQLLYDHALNHFLADRFGVPPDWERAARAWQEAVKRAHNDSQRFECTLNEARVHLRAGNSGPARVCLEQARALAPDSPVVRQLLNELKD